MSRSFVAAEWSGRLILLRTAVCGGGVGLLLSPPSACSHWNGRDSFPDPRRSCLPRHCDANKKFQGCGVLHTCRMILLQVFKGIRSRECVQVVHQRHIIRAAGGTANRGPGAGDCRKLISLLQWRILEPLEFGFPLRLEVVSGSPFVLENCTYNSHEVHAS